MAAAKEVRSKIASVKNTQKITKAMEMVAASKMRKAQSRMHAARPYAEKIRNVVAHLGDANTEYKHPFLVEREEVKNIGLMIVTTDRGLCGGLNANLLRTVVGQIRDWEGEGKSSALCVIGQKGTGYFSRFGGKILGQVARIGDQPTVEKLLGTVRIMLDAYLKEEIDEFYIVSNNFVNSMVQTPEIERLIPILAHNEKELAHHWDYIYEPEPRVAVDTLMERYIESLVYQRVIENIACEQSARMVAMKSASDNAGKLIDELQLIYNKARQAAITQELSEVVSGAAAV